MPAECAWLQNLPEEVLMCDVDRYVDRLYEPSLQQLKIPVIKTEWHRYAADLNRIPEDIDRDSVQGNANSSGTNSRGFHWVITTTNIPLMKSPMTTDAHQKLVKEIYEPFHVGIENQYTKLKSEGCNNFYHIDAHSMPSLGTDQHRDPGEFRADIVVSDCRGKSSRREFVDLIILAYVRAGFKVGYNWPYFGGRVSEKYGDPANHRHAVQVELNRALYMDEVSKRYLPEKAAQVQKKIQLALETIVAGLPE